MLDEDRCDGYIVPHVVVITTIKLPGSGSKKPGHPWSSRCFVQKFLTPSISPLFQEFSMNQVPHQARRRLWVAGTTLTAGTIITADRNAAIVPSLPAK